MPHDKNGRELRPGQIVSVLCKVKAVHLDENHCNVDLETALPMFPGNDRVFLTLNGKQVEIL